MAVSAPYDPSTGLNTTLPNALLTPDLSAQNAEQQRQMLARALKQSQSAGDYSPIQSPWQGAARLAQGLMGGLQIAAANRAQQTGQAAANTAFGNLFNGISGGLHPIAGAAADIPAAPPPAPAAAPPAPGTPAPVAAADPEATMPVAQFLAGIKAGEGVPYSGQSPTGAIGAYGLTGDFIKQWAPGAGLPTDRASYMSNPNLQDQLATYAAGQMHDKYGSWPSVANAWLTGSPTSTVSAPGNMSPHAYVAKVMGAANAQPSPQVATATRPTQLAGDVPSIGAVPIPPPRPDAIPPVPSIGPYGEPSFSKGEPQIGPGVPGPLTPQERSGLTNPPPPAPYAPPPPPPPGPPTAPHSGPVQVGNYKGQDYTYQAPAGQSPPVVPAGAASVPVPPPVAPPVAPPAQVASSAPPPPTVTSGGPAIVVPGYEEAGKVTRAQADDSEGKPSTADWDAAAKGQSGTNGDNRGLSPSVQVPGPVPAPAPPRAAPQALAPVQQPSFLQSLANALGGGPTVPDGRGGFAPPTNSRYDPATGNFLPPAQQAQALSAALAGRPSPPPAPSGLGGFLSSIFSPPISPGRSASPQIVASAAAPQPASASAQPQSFNGVSPQNIKDAQTLLQSPYASPEYKKFAMEVLERAVKPQPHVLTQAELTPAEREAGGEWQLSASGERSQVKGTEADTTRAPNAEESAMIAAAGDDPKGYRMKDGMPVPIAPVRPSEKKELREIGETPFGKQYGIFDPGTGQITPYKMPEIPGQPATPAQIQELGLANADAGQGDKTPLVPLPPDQQARLAQVRPEIRSTVESILQGRLGLPKITAGRGNPLPLAITQAVLAVNPQFDANTNQNQLLARKAFNAGGSNNTPGQLILNSDSALDHFEPLVKASDALPNYGSILGPSTVGTQRAVPGNLAGEDFKNKVAALTSAATPASAETMKYLAGTTGGGEGERENLIKSFSDIGGSPASRRQSVVNYIDDMLAKKAEMQNQWHTAMGPNAPDFPVISDTARAAVNRMGYGDLLKKYGLDKAPGQQTRSDAAPGGAPPVTQSTKPGPIPVGGETTINGVRIKRLD